MSLPVFPQNLALSYSIDIDEEYKTLTTDMESGSEQATRCWAFPKRTVKLKCDRIDEDIIKDLWQFYRARHGAHETFYYIFPDLRHWYDEYVAQADGELTTFDLPSLSTVETSLTVYVDAVETSVSFASGGGDAGADRITFDPAPALGAVITADFLGKLRLRGRFESDKLTYSLIRYLLYSYSGVGIRERRAA